MAHKLADEAKKNFLALGANPYPGRGIVVGIDGAGYYLVLIYWLMGRSDNSRNRALAKGKEWGSLYTVPANPDRMITDPSLTIYQAMGERADGVYVVSNGVQTETVLCEYRESFDLGDILRRKYQYEPDAPNFTPRITAVCALGCDDLKVSMSILRRSLFTDACDQEIYCYEGFGAFGAGYGRCITTYNGDGNPLPAFDSKPLLVPIGLVSIEEIGRGYWDNLNTENRIALAVKKVDLKSGVSETHIINRY
ncbi:inosine monophosphate cyclohydrolase [Patescibacteria group bacterium]|nr:inosine monophosphate cyclohydrolase [Patescibacteria group bacterium]